MITDRETGILVPPGDQVALAQALTSLLSNTALGIRLGVNAKLSATRFAKEAMLEETVDLLSSLVTPGMTSSSS